MGNEKRCNVLILRKLQLLRYKVDERIMALELRVGDGVSLTFLSEMRCSLVFCGVAVLGTPHAPPRKIVGKSACRTGVILLCV